MNNSWTRFFSRTAPNIVLRVVLMFVGMACIALSVGLTRATDLGTPTISSLPAVLSFATPITIGTWTFALNLLFVAAQAILLRHSFKPAQLLAIPFVFVFSALIDLFVPIGQMIPMANYGVRIGICGIGCFLTAFGVWLQTKAALVLLPGDGLVQAISYVSRKDMGTAKLAFDITMIALSAATSFVLMGGLYGVREGTLLAAIAVGPIIRLYERLLPKETMERFASTQGRITFIPER